LIEYKKFKDAAAFLVKREGEIDGLFAYQPEMVVDEQVPALAEVSIFDLIRSFQNVLKRFEETHDFGSIVDDRFTVADKIELLLHRLQPGQSIQFEQIFQQATTKTEVIVTFLAILELMKMNQFVIRQNHILGEIEVERRMVGAGAASGGPVEAED
jgi:segregation and condensation protein A